MHQTRTDTPRLDILENVHYGTSLLDAMRETLQVRGYEIRHTVLGSIGMNFDRSLSVAVTGDVAHPSRPDTGAAIMHAPFYLYGPFTKDSVIQPLLATIYQKLVGMDIAAEDTTVVPEMIPLGKALGGGMVFIIFVGGYEVPPSYAGQTTEESTGLVQTKIAVHEVSQSSIRLYVLDAGNGHVIWADNETRAGGALYVDKYLSLLEVVTRDLP
jgi:hypothetical protein